MQQLQLVIFASLSTQIVSSIIMILIAFIFLVNRERLLDYYLEMNYRNGREIDKRLLKVRISVLLIFMIMLGVFGIISS